MALRLEKYQPRSPDTWRYCGLARRRCGSNNRSNNRGSMEQTLNSGFPWLLLKAYWPGHPPPIPVNLENLCLWDPKIVSLGALRVPCKACMCVQRDMRYLGLLYRACGLALRNLCNNECEVGPCGCNQKGMGMAIREIREWWQGCPFGLFMYSECSHASMLYTEPLFRSTKQVRPAPVWCELLYFFYIPLCRCNLEIGCFYDARVVIFT